MKRLIVLLLCTAAFLFAAGFVALAQQIVSGYGDTTNTLPLNVRDNPSLNSTVIGKIAPNTVDLPLIIYVTDASPGQGVGPGWWGVEFVDDNGEVQEGWASSRYINTKVPPITLVPPTPTLPVATRGATFAPATPTQEVLPTMTATVTPVATETAGGEPAVCGEVNTIVVNIYLFDLGRD